MEWLAHNLTLAAALVLGWFVFRVSNRVRLLEKLVLEKLSRDPSGDLVAVVNRMATSMIRPEPPEAERIRAEGTRDALELMDHYIGHRLFNHIPALRRVLSLQIGISLDLLAEKTGIVAGDLKGLEAHLSINGEAFYPACSMVIEEWATHSVIRDFSGLRDVLYPGRNSSFFGPVPIWQHELPKRDGEWSEPHLEVVLHDGHIKFWARDGRFGRRIPPEPVPDDEHVFTVIPISEEELTEYRSDVGKPSEDPEIRIAQKPWIRHYAYGSIAEGLWWNLTVNDVVAYVGNR
jgi:hypothetical protein